MRYILAIFAVLFFCSALAQAQTLKALAYNTTSGQIVYSGTNTLTFSNVAFNQVVASDLTTDNLTVEGAIYFTESLTNVSITRTNLGLGATWLTNNNVANFRTAIGLGATNSPLFQSVKITNNASFIDVTSYGIIGYNAEIDLEEKDLTAGSGYDWNFSGSGIVAAGTIEFVNATNAATTRTNLGLGATWLTNNNVTNFRTAIGLGATSAVTFGNLTLANGGLALGDATTNSVLIVIGNSGFSIEGDLSGQPLFEFVGTNLAAQARKDFGLGVTNVVTFAGLTNNGDITINQTTASNGLLFIRRTNNEPFLGIANLIASNNTTLSNETLFRVGIAEATNKSAQFGFRTVRTNNGGEGFAVFSVFGYNALMMIGPSDRSRTNTATNAGIEADIWTITPTNRVMTLRDTNNGALMFHQEIGWSSGSVTTNAPANTTNVATWLEVWIGTNAYRLPLYQ